ncbi:hypothetical protein LCGC14_1581780, partial [marine sediment metagenome]
LNTAPSIEVIINSTPGNLNVTSSTLHMFNVSQFDVDSDEIFITKYQWYNSSDGTTYTIVTGFTDSGELSLADDIMVSGETYVLYNARFIVANTGYYVVIGRVMYQQVIANKEYYSGIYVNGSIIRGDKGLSFFPAGSGRATTFGTIKVEGQTEKGFTDVQAFNIQQITKGINLGEFRGYEMGTTKLITKYQPKLQVSRFFKVPKGRGIVIKTKSGIDTIKQFLEKKQVRKGGEGIMEIETRGRTLIAEKRQEPLETEPFQTKPRVFDITEKSLKLGKVIKEKPIESRGYIFSEKRLGEFIKLGEPISVKEYKIVKGKRVKKTPLEKTFRTEPEIKSDLSSPPQKAIQIKKTKDMKEVIERTNIGKITETTRKGLKGRTQKVVETLKTITTDIPRSVLGEASRSRQKVKTELREISKYKLQQKPRLDTSVIEISKELQKAKLSSRELEKVRQIQKQLSEPKLQVVSIRPKIRKPKPPRPVSKLIPLWLGRKRKIAEKPSKRKGYNVFVKPPKRKKYVKVTKKPVVLTEARDARNYFIDETTSRQGYIKPTKQKANPLMFDIPKNYARATRQKFRTFKQKKGKRTKLPKERVIERGKYLIDTRGEKQQLDIFKAMARAEKRKRKSNKPIGLQFA